MVWTDVLESPSRLATHALLHPTTAPEELVGPANSEGPKRHIPHHVRVCRTKMDLLSTIRTVWTKVNGTARHFTIDVSRYSDRKIVAIHQGY